MGLVRVGRDGLPVEDGFGRVSCQRFAGRLPDSAAGSASTWQTAQTLPARLSIRIRSTRSVSSQGRQSSFEGSTLEGPNAKARVTEGAWGRHRGDWDFGAAGQWDLIRFVS